MKKLPILLTFIAAILASCDFTYDPGSSGEKTSGNQDKDDTHEHTDLNHDHLCDICNFKITNCNDLNPKDHHCDICQKTISEHIDGNGDFVCDICNENMSKPIHNHSDLNHDHKCDDCQTIISYCADVNPKDHKCDLCGKVLTQCSDSNSDGKCDVCGKTLGGGGGQVTTTDYTSTWPEEYQPYVKSYLNGMVPCYLNTNKKCLFNGFKTKCIDGEPIPYFNPYVENTSPTINYTHDYGTILSDAGFKFIESEPDEDGDEVFYYEKGYCKVQFSKYKSDGKYYFDVYAYYDYYCDTIFENSWNIQYDNPDLALKNAYDKNNKTVTIKNWSITLNSVMKNSESIQLKTNTGKITIRGAIKAIYVEFYPQNGGNSYNIDDFMVKAGTGSSNAKYIFNEGGLYTFPSGTNYVEMFATDQVVNIEFFDLIY